MSTRSLALLVAEKFSDAREQLAVLEKVLQGRLSLEYLSWNGKTTPPLLPTDRC